MIGFGAFCTAITVTGVYPLLQVAHHCLELSTGDAQWGNGRGSLAFYLQERLQQNGHGVTFSLCEDWGWWLELLSLTPSLPGTGQASLADPGLRQGLVG
ncbi:MAG: hypothetical protein QUV07_00545 [Cyanobium sp. CZS 25K]|nr:hypothetical protein [Cyanobium sp. CZS25K]